MKVSLPYISATSLSQWRKDRTEFFLKYGLKSPRIPQTEPMAIGSIFDAYIKGYLNEKFYGTNNSVALFEQQVEPQNRHLLEKGICVFEQYARMGCAADLMLELKQPKFEGDLRVNFRDIPIRIKPDLYDDGVVIDWKVNGYFSVASPKKGYIKIRPEFKSHKEAVVVDGVNVAADILDIDQDWATQLCLYSMGLGMGAGTKIGIDQLVFRDGVMRVAVHRYRLSERLYEQTYKDLVHMWECLQKGRIFEDLTDEEDQAKQEQLIAAYSIRDENDLWFAKACRGGSSYS